MKRDLNKAYAEYLKLSKKGIGRIYRSDVVQIIEMCKSDRGREIGRALQVGYALGYRNAKKR